ncbi:VOC family protein [Nonomuraea ferruginea]
MISELRVTTVAVSDLDRSRAFYADTFGYVPHAEAEVRGPAAEAAWQMPAGLTGRAVVMGPEGATTGLLRLVQFAAPGRPYWGSTPARRTTATTRSTSGSATSTPPWHGWWRRAAGRSRSRPAGP